jgi:predicted MPP superfamily phosphohydrolase
MSRRGITERLAARAAWVVGLGGQALARVGVVRYRLRPNGWPNGLKLRIGVISDVHACEPWMSEERIDAICEQMNNLGADIVLLLGDYCSDMKLVTRYLSPHEWARPLATLDAPLGVHAILGNHDWWDDPITRADDCSAPLARQALEAVGIPVYSNHAVRLQHDGRPFWLAGLDDQLAIRRTDDWRTAKGKHDLTGTLQQVTDDAPIILMAHEPDIFPSVPRRVSLTLSGHTHGGQVRLFGRAPLVPSRYGDRYAYGHIQEGGRDIIISGGVNYSMLPIRFACPPEINLIELH